jgi:aldehyde dehydrogenase (NAD+)
VRTSSYIDGKWVATDNWFPVENPATEETIVEVAACSLGDIEAAVQAARTSFDTGEWPRRPDRDRIATVREMLDHLRTQESEIAAALMAEAGATTRNIAGQVSAPIADLLEVLEMYASLPPDTFNPWPTERLVQPDAVTLSLNTYEPVGVVAAISAFNYPFLGPLWKVIPALLTGNTVVLRPSPLTPLSAIWLAEAADAVGLPAGALNVVIESGSEGAALMTRHPYVDQITFTGSTTVGRKVMEQAAPTIKRLALELGGKSVQLYLPDATDRAPENVVSVFKNHAGQACVAATRVLVPMDATEEVVTRIVQATERLRVGPPSDATVDVGPLISAAQRARCQAYVQRSVEGGGRVAVGGHAMAHHPRGYYFEPTVITIDDNSNAAAQDEIFGPVVTVQGYRNVDEAIDIANDSIYGLSGQVFGANLVEAVDVARRIRAGAVHVNGSFSGPYASSGGYKQSGLSRKRGLEGLRAFQQVKHLTVRPLKPSAGPA